MASEQLGRKLTTILVSDVVGYSRLAGANEELTLARLRALRSDLIDPIVSVHRGRIVKRTGDGSVVEFASVVDAVRCAIEVQNGMIERNSGVPSERKIEFRIGIHLGDVMVESDGDLMGDGVNIAARLEGICAPGAICLSEDAYRQVKSRLDLTVTDLGDRELKNISETVHVYSLEVGKPIIASAIAAPAKTALTRRGTTPAKAGVHASSAATGRGMDTGFRRYGAVFIVAIVALIVLVGGAGWYFLGGQKTVPAQTAATPMESPKPAAALTAAPAHLSIVVLPFANLSGDPSQDYFADGITENLTTDLSRIRNSFVIARNTAFTFKGKNIDAKEIGKELGVRYVLEGSVQRDGNRVRVNAQLIDAESGAHLWADRFEEDLANLFKLQDDVVARLANTLGYELVKAEAAKSAHSTNPDSIDLTMQAWDAFWEPPTKENMTRVRDFAERALKLDPQNAEAMVALAYVRIRLALYGFTTAPEDQPEAQMALLDRATTINPRYAFGFYAKSFALFMMERFAEAVEAAQAGVDADPNSAFAYFGMGQAEWPLGRCDQSIAHDKEAFRLSPRDPYSGVWHMNLGNGELCRGNYDAAIAEYKRAIEIGYQSHIVFLYWAAAAALKGDDASAKWALAQARKRDPSLTIKSVLARRGAITAAVMEGLRKAGLPEDEGPRLSIVVLPFANIGDPGQDYIADAITEELTTALSKLRDSFVIARTTAMTYKGKPIDVKQIGTELGVRYVLEGSAQRGGDRVRVTAQLIDAETGAHLWGDQFDQPRAELLDMQDTIVTRLARTLNFELGEADVARTIRVKAGNFDAEDLAMQCQLEWERLSVAEPTKLPEAYRLCENSLALDPKNIRALGILAWGAIEPVLVLQSPDPAADIRKADELVARIFALDPNDFMGHYVKSNIFGAQSQWEDERAEAERALAANPTFISPYINECWADNVLGKPQDALTCVERALRLSPKDPLAPYFLLQKGWAFLQLDRYDDSVSAMRQSVALAPSDPLLKNQLAYNLMARVTAGQSGDRDGDIREAGGIADQSLAGNANDLFARLPKALALIQQNKLADALEAMAPIPPGIRGIYFVYHARCDALAHLGRADEAIACADALIALGPHQNRHEEYLDKGWALMMERKDADAVAAFRSSVETRPTASFPRAFLAAALGESGQDAEAHDALKGYLGCSGVRMKTFAAWRDYWNNWPTESPTMLDFRKRFLDGLRKAGMPEE